MLQLTQLSLFRGLTADQIRSLLSVCQARKYKVGEVVCDAGTDSTEMFLLFSGELFVSTESGIPIATLMPVTTVGEMGIITEQPRTAMVQAAKESEAFVISRQQFRLLVQEDENIGVKVYQNMAQSLCDKIINDNVRMRDYHATKDSYEQNIVKYRNQVEVLKGLLAERASMSEAKIEAEMAKRCSPDG